MTNMTDHFACWHPELGENTNGSSTTPEYDNEASHVLRKSAQNYQVQLRFYRKGFMFQAMLRTLESFYVVPCRPYFRDVVIPTLYMKAKIKDEESLQQVGRDAVTADAGTSISMDSFVTLTAHYINDNQQLMFLHTLRSMI